MRALALLIICLQSIISAAPAVSSEAKLLPEVLTVSPGKPFTVALALSHPPEWHSYYKNSGGVELPPKITVKAPENTNVGPIQWPAPTVKDGFAGKSFIYEGSPHFLLEITPPPSLSIGDTFTFTATAEWQICKITCINENAEFSLSLPVSTSPAINPELKQTFAKARENIPKLLKGASATIIPESANNILLEIPAQATQPADFIPDQASIKSLSADGTIQINGDTIAINLQRNTVDILDEPIPQDSRISGILLTDPPLRISEIPLAAPPPANIEARKYLPILGGMFLGGLILNLMPCVFPVIGLKIMGFVQQTGQNRRSIALHGIAFTIGVLASFAVLSGILFALRAAALRTGGELSGWGYQLQNPWVVLGLLLLMFILALNMFGIFELGTSATSVGGKWQNKSGLSGSFLSGILATVVATPCSAPFLGAAIGAAMSLPALQFFVAFTAMAFGLALPYLILSLFPALLKFLPRPGAWMETFKQSMSFLLFATAGYLLWVYSGLIGQENLLLPILGLSIIAAATWIYGKWSLPHLSKRTRTTALAITTLFAAAGIALSLPPDKDNLWQEWSPEIVSELTSQNTPVFVDYTAQWCLTCQVNKRVAYTEEVRALAAEKGITFLKADKTRPNPQIDAALDQLGRTAIPVNVLLLPGQDPIITPEILTPAYLMELFSSIP